MADPPPDRCSEWSRAAGEPLSATAATAQHWLLLEVPGRWPRDVAAGDGLPGGARRRVVAWSAGSGARRVLFVRRATRHAGLLAFVVRAEESASEVRRIELEDHASLDTVDLERDGDRVDTRLTLVCGHGSRDSCCALHGTAVTLSLTEHLGDEELWTSSHHGGHRFAANVLVLPAGLQFGRIEPAEAPSLVARALAGRIELGRYRGRTCYAPEVQAAEHAVRTTVGLEDVSGLRLLDVEGSRVRFRSRGDAVHEALVEQVVGPDVPASCGAEPEARPRLVARVL